jgi:hypothetical protein
VKGFLSRLFRSRESGGETAPGAAVEYKGYRIRPAPFAEGGEFQTAGLIEKGFPDGLKAHRFIRAEKHPSEQQAAEFALSKGRQIVDQMGDRMFDER